MEEYAFEAVIFDLDGVVTKTALVHSRSWKETFDEYLIMRDKRDGETFKEFSHENDYLPFVDGKPRYDGVKGFLDSRGITVPYGDPSDPPGKETVCGIGNRKNELFRDIVRAQGAEIYHSTIEFITKLRETGIKVGVASSSKNCRAILEAVGIVDLFETRVDGEVSAELNLQGKPEGDIFVTAAANLQAAPAKSVVVEDATSGVAAGRNGGFGLVLGIAREASPTELFDNGADAVVSDMEWIDRWFRRTPPSLFGVWDEPHDEKTGPVAINPWYSRCGRKAFFSGKKLAIFLDYDGTLTPIVSRPDLAILTDEMRDTVKRLSLKHTTAVVSGRFRGDVENLVNIDGFFYAGSHGFDIKGPGFAMINPAVKDLVPQVDSMIEILKKELGDIPGLLVEEKKFSVAVHYRLVDEATYLVGIQSFVDKVVDENPDFRLMHGKKVFEILPAMDWNKGKAIRSILQALDISWNDTTVIYIGDDTTDEDAFRVVRSRGTNVLVCDHAKPSSADFQIANPDEVKDLFEKILAES